MTCPPHSYTRLCVSYTQVTFRNVYAPRHVGAAGDESRSSGMHSLGWRCGPRYGFSLERRTNPPAPPSAPSLTPAIPSGRLRRPRVEAPPGGRSRNRLLAESTRGRSSVVQPRAAAPGARHAPRRASAGCARHSQRSGTAWNVLRAHVASRSCTYARAHRISV
eukprot:2960097-Prymnesium_polylepis.3